MVNRLISVNLWKESTNSWLLLKSIFQRRNFQLGNPSLSLIFPLLQVSLLCSASCLVKDKEKDFRILLPGIYPSLEQMLKLAPMNSLKKPMKPSKEERKPLRRNKRRKLKQKKKMMMTFSEMMMMMEQVQSQLPNLLSSKKRRRKLLLNQSQFLMLRYMNKKLTYKNCSIK